MIKIRFLRHATLIVEIDGLNILVDPMLSPAGANEAIPNTLNQRRNPLIDLPLPNEKLFDLIFNLDAVLITHTHSDHWDKAAQLMLPKDIPVYCQPADVESIHLSGYESVYPVHSAAQLHNLEIFRTSGQHGTGDLGKRMGPVSGFVLRSGKFGRLYVAGDTIWCQEVEQALSEHEPNVVIVNAGGARFIDSVPITMTDSDVAKVCRSAPDAAVVAVHMEAINHCLLSRRELRRHLAGEGLPALIPEDGEIVAFPRFSDDPES